MLSFLKAKIKNFRIKGFSLVEVLMATGMAAGGALLLANYLMQSDIRMRLIEGSGQIFEAHSEIRGFLSTTAICDHNFAGMNVLVQAELPNLRDVNNGVRYAPGTDLGNATVKRILFGGSFSALTDPNFGTFPVVIQYEKEADKKKILVNKTIELVGTVNAGALVTCSSYSSAASGHWTKDLETNALSYILGNIGIGETADSDVPLKVLSGDNTSILRLKHPEGAIDLGANGSAGLLVQGNGLCQSNGVNCPSNLNCGVELFDCQNYQAWSHWCGNPTNPGSSVGHEPCVTHSGSVSQFRCPRDRIANEIQVITDGSGHRQVNHLMCCKMRLKSCNYP